MSSLVSFFKSSIFFTPFIYIALYLLIERNFSHYSLIQYVLKIFTVLGGLLLIIYACTAQLDCTVLMPSRGGAKNYIAASLFLVIVGIATMALPLYSKYIRFSNSND